MIDGSRTQKDCLASILSQFLCSWLLALSARASLIAQACNVVSQLNGFFPADKTFFNECGPPPPVPPHHA